MPEPQAGEALNTEDTHSRKTWAHGAPTDTACSRRGGRTPVARHPAWLLLASPGSHAREPDPSESGGVLSRPQTLSGYWSPSKVQRRLLGKVQRPRRSRGCGTVCAALEPGGPCRALHQARPGHAGRRQFPRSGRVGQHP